MWHKGRHWGVAKVAGRRQLADKLVNHSWTLCTGFEHGGYLWLNDSLSEDGAAEFGVVRADTLEQVESITFGWCSEDQAVEHIRAVIEGGAELPVISRVKDKQIERDHEPCHLCR